MSIVQLEEEQKESKSLVEQTQARLDSAARKVEATHEKRYVECTRVNYAALVALVASGNIHTMSTLQ